MAVDEQVKVVITAEDKASGVLAGVGKNFATFGKVAGAALAATGVAAIAFGVSSVKAFGEAEVAQKRLEKILKTSVDASDDQIKALNEQAKALQRVGVVSEDVITAGQGTFATFDLQAESIKKLTPAFLDMVVAEKGVNATTQDMISFANGLGQALQGNFASLTQRGFILDEDTKAMIENGTETERVAALVKVMDSTYQGMNETMRNTTEGSLKALSFAFEDLKQQVGGVLAQALTPLIKTLTDWISDPRTQAFMMGLVDAFKDLLFWTGELYRIVRDFISGAIDPLRNAFGNVSTFVKEQVVPVLQDMWVVAKEFLGPALQELWTTIQENLLPALQRLWETLAPVLIPVLKALAVILGVALYGAILIVAQIIIQTVNEVANMIAFFAKLATFITNVLVKAFEVVTQTLDSIANTILKIIDLAARAFNALKSLAHIPGGAIIKGLIPGLATGGPVTANQPFIVGERGPELFVPSQSGNIVPNNKLGGGSNVTFNITGTFLSEDAAEQMAEKLMRILKLELRI